MEHPRKFEEEAEILEEKAEESPDELHTSVISDPRTPPITDVLNSDRSKVRETWGVISASLGAMGPLVGKLDKLLQDPPQGCSSESVKDLLKDVTEMSSCLHKLSEVEDPPPPAKCWMNEARDLSYKMEDYIDSLLFVQPADPSLVADKIQTTRSFRKWFSHVKTSPKRLEWHEQVAAMLSEFKEYAQDVIHRHKVYVLPNSKIESTLSHRVAVSVGPMLPMPYEETVDIVIDDRMNEFINSLANDRDKQLKVVSVLGPACLGKTTLARVFYNKFGKRYHCQAFIRVSTKPDMKRIFRDILLQLRRQDYPDYYCELELIDDIKNYLQNKRYLIIIDDVWAASVWSIIKHAFPKGNHGSRIITTTQIEDVALTCCCYQSENVFEVKPLDDDHSRKLFFNKLFGSESNCPEQLKEDSNEIVEICGGLPLATISIASLLASQPVMTNELLRYIHKSLGSCFSANSSSERTRLALNLSFNNLPQYLKTCLLYLSMYQEGYTFCKDDLVKQWMAECFIDTTEGQDMVEVAESYLDQLIGRRFIQPIHINYNNEVLSCAVHGTVHDLIAHKSAEENFIMAIDYSCGKNVALSDKVRRLSILFGDARYAKIPATIIKSQVRSLNFFGILECMPSITEYKLLCVLDLHVSGHAGDKNVDLTGISELFQLRYLKIACDGHFIKLPTNGLQCLETLNIMDATVVTYQLSLPQLLHLSLPFEQRLLDGIGSSRSPLGSLNLGSAVRLNNLQDLHLTAPMYDLESSEKTESSIKALCSLIGGHANLKSLVMAHGSRGKNMQVRRFLEESFNKLAPPPLLQRFECPPTNGITIFMVIPKWVGKLDNLSILKITVCQLVLSCVDMLRGMPALTALSLYVGITTFEKIIFDKAGFSVLKYFKLKCTTGMTWLKFETGAMPNLLKLKTVFTAIPRHQNLFFTSNHTRFEQYKHGNPLIIIEHMPGLREISAKFGGAAADVEYALRTFVSNHPSNPTINMQPVDYSSYGEENTTQKHQQDEIMEEEPDEYNKQEPDKILEEEPDEYDKTLERPDDKRISWPPKSSLRPHVPGDGSQSIRQDVNWEVSSRYPPEWVGWHKFSPDELISATSNFSEENLLGEGIFGPIYMGIIDGKIRVTITKLTYDSSLHPVRMHHPHMVRLLGYCHQDTHNIYVHEYMPMGSLKHHLFETNLIASLPWLTRLKIAVGAAKGLSFLHESANQRLSGQFSASSILLALDYTAKLWGFGRAKEYDVVSDSVRTENNVFNFGVVLLELLAGRPCYDEKRLGSENLVSLSRTFLPRKGKLHHIMDPRLEGKYSSSAAWSTAKTALRCLKRVPEERPSMRDVVDALEPLLSDDRNNGQSKKTNLSRWGSSLTRYGAVKGRGKAAKQAEGEAEGLTTTGASSLTLPMR